MEERNNLHCNNCNATFIQYENEAKYEFENTLICPLCDNDLEKVIKKKDLKMLVKKYALIKIGGGNVLGYVIVPTIDKNKLVSSKKNENGTKISIQYIVKNDLFNWT